MQLSEQGKVDIDKPVAEYLPEFSVKSRFSSPSSITVRDVLCQHAGLPCDNLQGYFTRDVTAFHSAIDFLPQSYLVYPPRTMFYYSILGYELLGVIISRVTGMQYHEYMENVFLKNVGMAHSAILLSDERMLALAKPYRKGKEQVEEMSKCIPEGGLHSTARDMAVFMNAMLNGGNGIFLNKDTLNKMLVPQYPDNFMDMDFKNGLGWFIGKPGLDHAGTVIWHDGGTPHFFSLTVLIPGRKTGITLLTNSTTGALMNHRAAVEILQAVLHEQHGIAVPVDDKKNECPLTDEIR